MNGRRLLIRSPSPDDYSPSIYFWEEMETASDDDSPSPLMLRSETPTRSLSTTPPIGFGWLDDPWYVDQNTGMMIRQAPVGAGPVPPNLPPRHAWLTDEARAELARIAAPHSAPLVRVGQWPNVQYVPARRESFDTMAYLLDRDALDSPFTSE